MKIIHSDGGPLVGLVREIAPYWSGSASKRFIGNQSRFATDYDAACAATLNIDRSHNSIGILSEQRGNALLVSMPLETAIIKVSAHAIYIAQVEYAEEKWSFSEIKESDFARARYEVSQKIQFHCGASVLLFFDAAYSLEEVGDNYLEFALVGGSYIFDAAIYCPNSQTGLILYKIVRML